MVLESIIDAFRAENKPSKLIFLGFFYTSIACALSFWIFESQSSLVFVFLIVMASIPLIMNIIKEEEKKDISDFHERVLLKEHGKALNAFMMLFIGITLATTLWYVALPATTTNTLFQTQTSTINQINGRVTGLAFGNLDVFGKIFFNNLKVLIFCILFSFLYGSGAIFILTWNASVIGTAIGNFIRTNLATIAHLVGFEHTAGYLKIVSLGLLKYVIHGVPEILAYFIGGLAGGIISIAVIRHDFEGRKFEHIILDTADLLLLSVLILFLAAIFEVYITPVVF